jgi:iron complex outermembrane receptor protein
VLQPVFLPGFSATVDWYDIQIEAAFEWSRWNLAFDQCYNGKIDFWCGVYKRDPQTGQLREIDARYSNSGYLKSRGIDFATTYNFDARRLGLDDFGMINLSFNGTLATKLDRQFAPGTPAWSCLGYHGFACGSPVPTWRHVAGVNWAFPQGQGGLGFTWRYTGGTQVSKLSTNSVLAARPNATDPDTFPLIRKLPAVTYIDFNANVALTRFLDVRFNVQNLFDKDPPIIGIDRNFAVGSVNNTYPDYYALRGRTLRVGLTARF